MEPAARSPRHRLPQLAAVTALLVAIAACAADAHDAHLGTPTSAPPAVATSTTATAPTSTEPSATTTQAMDVGALTPPLWGLAAWSGSPPTPELYAIKHSVAQEMRRFVMERPQLHTVLLASPGKHHSTDNIIIVI